jgi:benzylsuccinate CoA-transferase BbsF subunit
VERLVTAAGVPAGKVQRSRDLAVDPQYQHRRFYRHLEHPEVGMVTYAGHQFRIEGYDNGPRFAAPMLGQHTYEVLTGFLGLTDDEVAEAAAAGALE